MSAKLIVIDHPMTVIERASTALSKAEVEAEIKVLVERSKPIVAVTDPKSREVCHEALMVLRTMRTQTQKRAKDGRDEAVQYSKAVIAIEKELVALIEPEETRLSALRDEWDAIKEREKQAKIDAEIRRVSILQGRIAELRGNQMLTPASGSQLIGLHISNLDAIPVDDSFEEFRQQAEDAKAAGLARLNALQTAAFTHEAEQARLKAEREELARLRAEDAERARVAKEAQAKADAEAKAERDRLEIVARQEREAEAKRQAEEIAKQRAENEKLAAERRAQLDAEEAQARAAREVEEARLAAERAELSRQQEELRKASAPKPKPRKAPTGQELVELVAKTYQVTPKVALGWLLKIDFRGEVAE